MADPFVSIILRSYNEGWALRDTLPALCAQDYRSWELIVIDSGSTDGSVELIRKAQPAHFIQIRHEDYNPSRVMNHGMELARSEFGIFLNADATPQGSDWLRPLVMALQDPRVAAVFGRQIPRPDCQAVYAHDYERCFGRDRESTQWEHFFSMVSSGLRKDIWRRRGFLEKMQYSEDDEYTRWCRAVGYRIVFVPDSVVMHSHNYTPQQAYKRSFGEAKALAAVWNGAPNQVNFPRTVLLGWTNDARRDLLFCSREKRLHEWPHAARIRWQQRRAKLAGFREGWRFYRNGNGSAPLRPGEKNRIQVNSPELPSAQFSPSPPCNGGEGRGEEALRAHGETSFDVRRSMFDVLSRRSAAKADRCSPVLPHQNRFTLDGSDTLELHLAEICNSVLSGVQELLPPNTLEALVLGGGYGRGQGGVLKTTYGDGPYNDLEFYVFTRGNRILNERKYADKLNSLGEWLSPKAGLHVEFKIDSLARLRRSPVTMFSYDLVSGHRVIFGNETVFDGCEHHRHAEKIPLSEATRLLFNRCTGLLLAKELLRKPALSPGEADFIGRNLAKAQLALGDVVLAAHGQYHWNCVERRKLLSTLLVGEQMPWLSEVKKNHAAGVEFKLHPEQISRPIASFQAEHDTISSLARQIWLWLESRRLHETFSSARDYAFSDAPKCSGSSSWRNALLNARSFGALSILDSSAARYPRERLLNALPLLLWDDPTNDLEVKRRLQKQLRTTASDWQGFVTAYKAVWPKFS